MSVLQLDPTTGYLPSGSHRARLDDIERAFGLGPRRTALMKGLREVVTRLDWPHPSPQPARRGDGTVPLVDWFRHDRDGNEKGVIELVLPETDEVSP